MPTVKSIRDRLPGALAAVLFHVALIAALLNAIPKYIVRMAPEPEAIILLTELAKKQPPVTHRTAHQSGSDSTTIPRYFYNFDHPFPAEQPNLQGLNLALSSCAPENLGNASDEVRTACRRIGMVVVANPGAFGLAPDYKNGKRWERELRIKQTPLLLPCASPTGNPFETLFCIVDVLQNGYDPDKMAHYSK